MQIETKREIKDGGSYDIVVVGGGVAGAAAALSGARNGKKVFLIEKGVLLGGLATIGLISWYEPLCNHQGKKMIGGIAQEFLLLSIKHGYDSLPPCWRTDEWEIDAGNHRYATLFSPTVFSLALTDLLLSEGVKLRLDTLATYPVMEGGRCKGIIAESAGGTEFFGAGVVIDASGDACVFSRAGIACEVGENYLSYVAHFAEFDRSDHTPFNTFKMRKWKNPASDLWGKGHPEGMKLFTGVSAEEITEFVLEGQKRLFDTVKTQHKDSREITSLPAMPQLRMIRRIHGEYTLTEKDLYRRRHDSVGRIGDFRYAGHWYEIPYGTLCSSKADNLLAAGRIISASGEGWEATRVIPVAALTGQAAGEAAALFLSGAHQSVCDIDVGVLGKNLQRKGIKLHFDD